jgi:hydroxymethylpyrimidine/phosphomethylpyrimidine kinase
VRESVALAHEYVKAALHGASSWRIGHGRGGLNHMGAQ